MAARSLAAKHADGMEHARMRERALDVEFGEALVESRPRR